MIPAPFFNQSYPMLSYPDIDPIAFSLGPLNVHWYGLMYLLGFVAAWRLALRRSKRPWSPIRKNQIEDLIVYSAFGVIFGGRFGYVLIFIILSDGFLIHSGCSASGKAACPFTVVC